MKDIYRSFSFFIVLAFIVIIFVCFLTNIDKSKAPSIDVVIVDNPVNNFGQGMSFVYLTEETYKWPSLNPDKRIINVSCSNLVFMILWEKEICEKEK